MKCKTKEVYSLLQDIFKNIWEQQKYSEIKNGILLTINLAMFAVMLRFSFSISDKILYDICTKSIFYVLAIFLIIHIFLIVQSFYPKNINQESDENINNDINIFFFKDIGKVTSSKYLDEVLNKMNIQAIDKEKKDILLDLSNQIVKLSEITQSKYSSFKWSIIRMYFISVPYFIYFTYLYFQ